MQDCKPTWSATKRQITKAHSGRGLSTQRQGLEKTCRGEERLENEHADA